MRIVLAEERVIRLLCGVCGLDEQEREESGMNEWYRPRHQSSINSIDHSIIV